MSGQLISLFDNVQFSLAKHTNAMAKYQEQAVTGSTVNRASDDSSKAFLLLGLETNQKTAENYINNLQTVMDSLDYASTAISSMQSVINDAKLAVSQIVSSVYDQDAKDRAADNIDDLLEQLVLLANTEQMGQYIFGGGNSSAAPYEIERTDGTITQVTYIGSSNSREVEVAANVKETRYHSGDDLFSLDNRQDVEFSDVTGAAAGTGTSSIKGDVWMTVINDGSNYKISIDDGLTYTTVPVGGETNQAVTNSETGQVLYVDTTGINATGTELVTAPGTHDIFNFLIGVRDMLLNEDGLDEAQIQDARLDSLEKFDSLYNLLIQNNVMLGSKIGFLDNLQESTQQLEYNAEDEAGRISEADIAEISIQLSKHELLYQMSLSMAAEMMSLSLFNYLQ